MSSLCNILGPFQENISWPHLCIENFSNFIDIIFVMIKQIRCKSQDIFHFFRGLNLIKDIDDDGIYLLLFQKVDNWSYIIRNFAFGLWIFIFILNFKYAIRGGIGLSWICLNEAFQDIEFIIELLYVLESEQDLFQKQ